MEKMRQWSILAAVGVVAVLGAGWFLLVSPQRSHASSLRQQAASQQQSNATLQSQVSQLQQQKLGLPAQQRALSQMAAKIPSDPELPSLIRQLSAAANRAGVDLRTLSPGAPTLATATPSSAGTSTTTSTTAPAGATSLAQIPVTLQVTGSYFNVESFFAAVEKLNRAMLVTAFTLTPDSASPGGSGGSGSPQTAAQVPGGMSASITAMVFESPSATTATPASPVVASTGTK